MKLSISNIAWPLKDEDAVLEYLRNRDFDAIEIAPSKIWGNLDNISAWDVEKYRDYIGGFGLGISSMHSLFYNTNGMKLFGNDEERSALLCFFNRLSDIAEILEAPCMVFGSPKVRRCGRGSMKEAMESASDILRKAGDYAYSRGTKILIEPLAVGDTNFINTHQEGLELSTAVKSKGFGLHLDAKAISSEGLQLNEIIEECGSRICHFHVNESGLGSFNSPQLQHEVMGEALKKIGYAGYASVEMKLLPEYFDEIKVAVDFLEKCYG